ncbi:DUF3021 domain-containing protein [Bacillus sp. MCCB 382]|uniref:DUF3021 family protein n=1 Tax=Bacillus sp. MCCB 382 TaxID=2860197 RepID=UPI001C55C4C6|nr:DUF3021 domain-containing protein [Bacillus sp. MCCB 382]
MNLLKKGLIRGSIPFMILTIISILLTFQESTAPSNDYFSLGVIAFFLGFTSVIYEIQQWRFLKQIIVHYLVMLVTVFPTLLLSGMYSIDSFEEVISVYVLFNKVGLFLFLITYLISKWRNRVYMRAHNQ